MMDNEENDVVESTAKSNKLIGFATVLCCLMLFGTLTPLTSHPILNRGEDSSGDELQSVFRDHSFRSLPRSLKSTTSHEQQRRSLSVVNTNACQSIPRIKQQQRGQIPPAYLATYPGSGSRITRQLIKALTGLPIQKEHAELPKNDAVAIQTRFPHKSGSLVGWDNDIHRAILLIRNPLHALPSLFDELYSSSKHLPAHFHPDQPAAIENDASVAEWVSWRDRMFDSQIISFREFIQYWVKRYGDQNERLILSYEDLMDEKTGIKETTRLIEFLRRKNVDTVELNDVPCVWKTVLAKGGGDDLDDGDDAADVGSRRRLRTNDMNLAKSWQSEVSRKETDLFDGGGRRQLDSYYILHPSSIDAAPDSRPFTIEQLKAMAHVLQQLSEELYTQAGHLKRLFSRYRREIMEIAKKHNNANTNSVGEQSEVPKRPPNFHIFQVSPPGTKSALVTNWLMGLFEPDAAYTTLVTSPGLRVIQHEKQVPITTTIVTQTNEMNVVGLYKIFKPGFDEVFFVLSKSGTEADQQFDGAVCEYGNVLCIEYEEQLHHNNKELQAMVHHLTKKFHLRFANMFGPLENPVGMGEQSAIARLQEMKSALQAMQNEPYGVVDQKYGVHGNFGKEGSDQKSQQYQGDSAELNVANDSNKIPPRRLFYCGSTGSGKNINHSILGIFLVNAFFPEIVGGVPRKDDTGTEAAILLTMSSINDATPNDFLVYHMHQHCDVDVLTFPGLQLHINHPTHGFSAYGEYKPPGKNIFVIGAHEDGPHSIQLPYAMMKWWVLVKGLGSHGDIDQPTIEKFFVPSARPKNTGKNFLLYVNSHYAAYREIAAHTLSTLGPVYALGSCQGNPDAIPTAVDALRPSRCQPYTDESRPPSIIVPEDLNRRGVFYNRVTFQDFRFMLLMEDANIPGYITERIVDGFMAGTIPIYYGTSQIFDIFNPKAFIYYDVNNPQEALDRIRYLEDNTDAYQQMLNEPILADGERTIEKYFSFDDTIGNGMLKRRVRSKLGFST
ncbi:hypothetical protein ACHAXR_012356 [Thalassiosira sp. AJA248-18]